MMSSLTTHHQMGGTPFVMTELSLCVTSETVLSGVCGYRVSVE